MVFTLNTAPRPVLQKLVRQYVSYTKPLPLRVAVGTYNINGGKHFRSIVYKDVSLSDWLLDAHKTDKTDGNFIFCVTFPIFMFVCVCKEKF